MWIRLPQRIRHGSQAALEQDWRNLENRGQKVSTDLWGRHTAFSWAYLECTQTHSVGVRG